MGFRFRKSVKFGGFRINFSKSGIGYSMGGSVFRTTKMANGRTRNTITIPKTGISYVTESSNKKKTVSQNSQSVSQTSPVIDTTYVVESEENFTPEAKKDFIDAIKTKFRIRKILLSLLWILPLLLVIFTILYGAFNKQTIFTVLVAVSMVAFFLDIVALIISPLFLKVKATYDYDDEFKDYAESLDNAIACLKECSKLWRINTITQIDKKKNGGASQELGLEEMSVIKKKPWFITTNAKCYCLKSKKEKCYILPNMAIIQCKNNVGTFDLTDINLLITDAKFITRSKIKDGNFLYYTYSYVNKDGSRDLRYKNNPQQYVYQVAKVDIKTNAGFHMIMQLSNVHKAVSFSEIITTMVEKYDVKEKDDEE